MGVLIAAFMKIRVVGMVPEVAPDQYFKKYLHG